ncbi:MAG TPA: signal peptidase I [Planctomycetaceae bacterium]|nr:signal peptidase I [Planctomycetaceae bacterium]
MGAHKDLFCEYCGYQFQASASSETDQETNAISDKVIVAAACPNCRGLNRLDLRGNPNHATFAGDRILVSKFDYVLGSPDRWDVFVFKFPNQARQNYIKRLVGLPGETLLIREGDVYVRKAASDPWEIARKPARKIHAMRRVVSDTGHPAPLLVKAGWPSLWQPVNDSSGWQVKHDVQSWNATLKAGSNPEVLRYYHFLPEFEAWEDILAGEQIEAPQPRQSRLVTDYLAYNTQQVFPRSRVYKSGSLREEIQSDSRIYDLAEKASGFRPASLLSTRGENWVGDLMGQFDVDIQSETGTVLVDLVEFGVRYQVAIDVATGEATLTATGDGVAEAFGDKLSTKGKSSISGAGSYRIEMSNFDDQIFVWVNGSLIDFDSSTAVDTWKFRSLDQRRPYYSDNDPLDAAPIGIGGQNVELTIQRAQVFRDIHYIAAQGSSFSEYSGNKAEVLEAVPDASVRRLLRWEDAIQAIYANPEWWAETDLFTLRRSREYQLEEDQYFPMGDNSAASSDARVWAGPKMVEGKYLLGKALLVFWPHTWNTPVPFTPNIARMRRIR